MSSAIDKALMAMSLEEDEEPFELPDLPQFSTAERNLLSIVGRLLNPECQNLSSLILDMPRKWKLYERVRGVALSSERFQFIFQSREDMEKILESGPHFYNEWGLAIDRWLEFPPVDYLQHILVWVQISNIPMNNNSPEAVMAYGDLLGEVKQVAMDPTKPQVRDFVRAQIKFDVSRPIKRSRALKLKGGGSSKLLFYFEKIQKRCFTCQRLTHAEERCPLRLAQKEEEKQSGKTKDQTEKEKEPFLKKTDPLFGVLKEDQVGINPVNGRPRIAADVLEGMRQYLLVANGDEKLIREARIKASMEALKGDLRSQRSVLTLEETPIITSDIDKGKGHVFEYELKQKEKLLCTATGKDKLMRSALKTGQAMVRCPQPEATLSEGYLSNSSFYSGRPQTSPTAIRVGLFEAGSSGTSLKKSRPRKRPYKSRRRPKPVMDSCVNKVPEGKAAGKLIAGTKRKAQESSVEENGRSKIPNLRVIPRVGLPLSE